MGVLIARGSVAVGLGVIEGVIEGFVDGLDVLGLGVSVIVLSGNGDNL